MFHPNAKDQSRRNHNDFSDWSFINLLLPCVYYASIAIRIDNSLSLDVLSGYRAENPGVWSAKAEISFVYRVDIKNWQIFCLISVFVKFLFCGEILEFTITWRLLLCVGAKALGKSLQKLKRESCRRRSSERSFYDVNFKRQCFNQINYENFLNKKGRKDMKFHKFLWNGGSAVECFQDFF